MLGFQSFHTAIKTLKELKLWIWLKKDKSII